MNYIETVSKFTNIISDFVCFSCEEILELGYHLQGTKVRTLHLSHPTFSACAFPSCSIFLKTFRTGQRIVQYDSKSCSLFLCWPACAFHNPLVIVATMESAGWLAFPFYLFPLSVNFFSFQFDAFQIVQQII